MKNKYYNRLFKIFILISLLLFLLGACTNYNSKPQNTNQNIIENEDIDKVKKKEIRTEFVKYIANNKEYVFEYANPDKKFLSEICAIEYYEKGSEFEIKVPIAYSGIAIQNSKIRYIIDLGIENSVIGCYSDGTGSEMRISKKYNVNYQKYEVIRKDKIDITENKEIILGAILFSKNKNIKIDKDKLWSTKVENRKQEYSKFDYGFILKFKME